MRATSGPEKESDCGPFGSCGPGAQALGVGPRPRPVTTRRGPEGGAPTLASCGISVAHPGSLRLGLLVGETGVQSGLRWRFSACSRVNDSARHMACRSLSRKSSLSLKYPKSSKSSTLVSALSQVQEIQSRFLLQLTFFPL